ncbi:MAG: hypothetical protein QCH99_11490 [Candidatus Bathyarchaeota archaeon]|nr:hypothetical protein [Candidatus Bathyarchaeum tardum]WGM89878.1 MAG: hypothetical protein NUK63_01795 [Candidatus Bathyarchaeum tardum]
MKQFLITPVAGKRLIAKALAKNPTILTALKKGTLVIVAGTTNGYVAEEIIKYLDFKGFSKTNFFRGITLPPGGAVTAEGRLVDESKFPGDVIITDGVWQKGKTIEDVADALKEGDVILKGANALNMNQKQAAVLIGHPKAGTIALIMQAVAGRRVKLIVPVGLEKRVNNDLYTLTEKLNSPDANGYRMVLVPGQLFTEIEAIQQLTGANAELIAAGGVYGAEGSYLLAVTGTDAQENYAEKLWKSIASEPPF